MSRRDFLSLSRDDRSEALLVAAARSGRPDYLLEKDVWVVWSLQVLFSAAMGEKLVFKGGTSLSKAYGVIRRFSEDVDLTCDIREFVTDATVESGEVRPPNRTRAKKWSDEARARLPIWVAQNVIPALESALRASNVPASVRQSNSDAFVEYECVTNTPSYVEPRVKLEFGARSTGEPCEHREVGCDAGTHLPELSFPAAQPRAMAAERTFWEKATAVHVFCMNGRAKADRYARHWHDLLKLDEAGIGVSALADRPLAEQVATYKNDFYREKDVEGKQIDYKQAVSGHICLVPQGELRERLGSDYREMVQAGLLQEDDILSFDEMMDLCAALEAKINAAA